MGPVKTATFSGNKYTVSIVGKVDGLCVNNCNERELLINTDIETQKGLETLIHESLHACNWHRQEIFVESTARDVARFLWRLGYRLRKVGK